MDDAMSGAPLSMVLNPELSPLNGLADLPPIDPLFLSKPELELDLHVEAQGGLDMDVGAAVMEQLDPKAVKKAQKAAAKQAARKVVLANNKRGREERAAQKLEDKKRIREEEKQERKLAKEEGRAEPRKPKVVLEGEERRKPGRPRKIRTEEDDVPVVKRPRGRPLGSKNKVKEGEELPPKVVVPKPVKEGGERRGRPAGSKNKPKVPLVEGELPLGDGEPKKRGRPVGSKNKTSPKKRAKKSDIAVGGEDGSDEDVELDLDDDDEIDDDGEDDGEGEDDIPENDGGIFSHAIINPFESEQQRLARLKDFPYAAEDIFGGLMVEQGEAGGNAYASGSGMIRV